MPKMNLPNVDFSKIRMHHGTQYGGFEELSVSLFRSEYGKPSEIHRVEGSGGDGGVEAFVYESSGNVVGLQSKYFHELKNRQWTQLERSIAEAKRNYPKLKKYIVTVPLDRTPAAISAWKKMVHKWKGIKLIWWGRSELLDKILQPNNSGKLIYWFGCHQFDIQQLRRSTDISISDLDTRYTPAHHTSTEAEIYLDSVAVSDTYLNKYSDLIYELTITARKLVNGFDKSLPETIIKPYQALRKLLSSQLQLFKSGKDVPKSFVVRNLCETIDEACVSLWSVLRQAAHASKDKHEAAKKIDTSSYINYNGNLVDDFRSKLYNIQGYLINMQLAEARKILLIGPAGAGKSHLLANLVSSALKRQQPALLLLGEYFLASNDPWCQLAERIGWEADIAEFLSVIDCEAELKGLPALLCIDAINESSHRKLWQSNMLSFVDRVAQYPNIRLIFSCRQDFVDLTLPPRVASRNDDTWSYIDHNGYGENIFEAVSSYFCGYNIKSEQFPPILPEFQNPLFLKTVCESFENTCLSPGSITLSRIMHARIQKVCDKILRDIDCPEYLTRKAIAVTAKLIGESSGNPICRDKLRPIIDELYSQAGESCSLYRHLRSSGLLVEIVHYDITSGTRLVKVRFPFERFSDYFIAEQMIAGFTDFNVLKKDFKIRGVLPNLLEDGGYNSLRGISQALCILIPERFGREFIKLIPKSKINPLHIQNFLGSLPWRAAESLNHESFGMMEQALRVLPEESWGALLTVASIPSHPFNAEYLHRVLQSLSLSNRDLKWTIPLCGGSHKDDIQEAKNIITWAFRVPKNLVSDEQAYLVAVVLCWLCTSNHRQLRYRATLAGMNILAGRSRVSARIIRAFCNINDPYVIERVFAIASGVAMRERDQAALKDLSDEVYASLFNKDYVTPNMLIRDFGRCVMEIAQQRGALDKHIEIAKFRPPYKSRWPDIWNEIKVKKIEKTEGWHTISYSVQPECTGMYGDFGRYVMQSKVSRFTKIPIASDRSPKRYGDAFDSMKARRWIVQRVFLLGWTPEKFEEYERSGRILRGRQSPDIERWRRERIGKKYQWIALHELLGFISDHFKMAPEWGGESQIFKGPWQFWERDFDPSQPLYDFEEDGLGRDNNAYALEETKKYDDPFKDPKLCADPNKWVRDAPADFKCLIEASSRMDNLKYLLLGGSFLWHEKSALGLLSPRPGKLKMWCNIRAWLVPQKHFQQTLKAVREIQFWGNGCRVCELHNQWLGLYPWGQEFEELRAVCAETDEWVGGRDLPIEQSFVQWSEDEFSALLPSPRLVELLGIQWSGDNYNFVNSRGELTTISTQEGRCEGAGSIFVSKSALVSAMKKKKWQVIWALVGDRSCYDYDSATNIADADLRFSAVYWLDGEKLKGGLTISELAYIPRPGSSKLLSEALARHINKTKTGGKMPLQKKTKPTTHTGR